MSCSKTVVQEVEKRNGGQIVDFEDFRDKDESKNIFDKENVASEPVPQPYVSLKLSDVLRSILASLKDAFVKSQVDSQSRNERQDVATTSTLQKGHNNCKVRDKIMKVANTAEPRKEEETEHLPLFSQYLNLKKNSEPRQLAKESQEEETEQ